MVVITIIALLAAIALPMYSNYTTRAKISSQMSKVGNLKTDISEELMRKGTITTPSFVKDPNVRYNANGVILINLGNDSAGTAEPLAKPIVDGRGYITLDPNVQSGSIVWSCKYATENDALTPSILPKGCEDGALFGGVARY